MEKTEIKNPKRRVLEDLKIRNKDNGSAIAGEYFGKKFSYNKTFKMIEDYKKAFIHLDGKQMEPITITELSTIAGVNAFYGSIAANKIANMVGPGFLHEYTEKHTKKIGSKTVFILDAFLNEELVIKLHKAGVKNVIITKITDYMHPIVKFIGKRKGLINDKDFLDEYLKSGKRLPLDMQFIRLSEFAKIGSKIKANVEFPYKENQIASYFLTGATTSKEPKSVQIYADGLTKMGQIYDHLDLGFKPGDRNAVFIPMFYATGAVHGVHAGLIHGVTNIYKPKYDKHAFAKDLKDSKANIAGVAPSHLATLEKSGLKKNELKHVNYIFVGGEAIPPAQMKKFKEAAKRLGIKHILNGYGMTETGSMSGISKINPLSDDDVTVKPLPGVKYRIVDPETREILPNNVRGILEKSSPCVTAGYLEEEKNKVLFTNDGWINTGDMAIRYNDGSYKIFGRYSDHFTNKNKKYFMFDIEEVLLEHPGIMEAEVIKFNLNNNEFPAAVIVLAKEWENQKEQILKDIEKISVPGSEFLLGSRFIENFETNRVTSKRDILSLLEMKKDYYKFNLYMDQIYKLNLENQNNVKLDIVNDLDSQSKVEEPKTLVLKR